MSHTDRITYLDYGPRNSLIMPNYSFGSLAIAPFLLPVLQSGYLLPCQQPGIAVYANMVSLDAVYSTKYPQLP